MERKDREREEEETDREGDRERPDGHRFSPILADKTFRF
jgi:hypothetical protein